MLAAARHKLPVVLHTPSEVKAAITGSGTAGKAQVGHMVARVLRLAEAPTPADAADAVALAICHVWRGAAANRYAQAAARASASRPADPGAGEPGGSDVQDDLASHRGGERDRCHLDRHRRRRVRGAALCTPATTAGVRLNQVASVHTSLVVREDSLTLYAFADADERDCFELAQTASGVGPKLAQALVSVLGPDEFRVAVLQENLVALCRVPGIGRKGAQKLVIELKDKVAALGGSTGAGAVVPAGGGGGVSR